MDSSIIGKIDKARKYAEEKDRVNINHFSATFPRQPQQLRRHFQRRGLGL